MKMARRSVREPWPCQKEWPEDCFVQCGGGGVVLVRDPKPGQDLSYRTAFFEAFPKDPQTFIRGEGATIEAAEASAFAKFEKYQACDHPSFERRKHRNGYGFCTACGMGKSEAFAPLEKCTVCQKPTYHGHDSTDANTGWYCEEHDAQRPRADWELEMDADLERRKNMTPAEVTEEMKVSLKTVLEAMAKGGKEE